MKRLTPLQNFIYQAGGIMLLSGTLLWLPKLNFAPFLYCIGAIAFSAMQFTASYEGKSLVLKRLRSQQVLGTVFLLITGALMFGNLYRVPYTTHNEWMVSLSIGALLELYTAFRIPAELKKDDKRP